MNVRECALILLTAQAYITQYSVTNGIYGGNILALFVVLGVIGVLRGCITLKFDNHLASLKHFGLAFGRSFAPFGLGFIGS